ncbi:MAG: hypothetical protein CSA82_03850 [Actinobacteria bacterium]|nr:MAG: hypothetical protein CSA82_03850 [Actinomycetota bacterium]
MKRFLSTRAKIFFGIVLAFFLALGAASAAYASYYRARALPGVTVIGESLIGKNREEVNSWLEEKITSAAVTVHVGGTDHTLPLSDAGVSIDTAAMVDQIFAPNQSVVSRFTAPFSPVNIAPVATIDETKIEDFARELASKDGKPVVDAAVKVSDDGASFVATPSQAGKSVESSALRDAVMRSAETLSPENVTLEVVEKEPQVTTEEAEAAAESANQFLPLNVSITDGIDDFSASPSDKVSWFSMEKTESGLEAPVLDDTKVTEWVKKLAKSTNEEPVPGVNNVNSLGDVVSVHDPGKKGWTVNNSEAVASEVLVALKEKKDYSGDFDYEETEPEFTTRLIADGAANHVYQAAPGERWIDIDLSANTVSAYEGATIMQGPMYMVPGAPDTPTVTGEFRVWLQYEYQTMRGENADGTPYVAEDVPWVTYFHNGYAMHGSPWRSSFGWSGPGGSHGCVNMPVSAAKWIYDWADIGTVVVSHY